MRKLGGVLLHRGGGGGGGGGRRRGKGGEGKKGRGHGERGRSQGEREGNLNFVTREKPWVSIYSAARATLFPIQARELVN